ncbi:MAG TPA: HAD family phosphatase [Steroidobacteraceae bacterium]
MIRNAIFDLGGVVLHWDPLPVLAQFEPDPQACRRLHAEFFGHSDWKQFDRGGLTESEVIERLQTRLGRPREQLRSIVAATSASLVEKPDTVRLLRSLQRRGVALYCLSNMPSSIYLEVQSRHSFWDVFKGIIISGEVRMSKPEPELFAHLLERFALQPQESVFIDDLPVNIEAAGAAGLHTVLFHDAAQCARDLERWFPSTIDSTSY